MKFLKIVLDFYINASIHVALSVFAFIKITEFYFYLPENKTLNVFVFLGTITGYNFIKYAGVAKLHHRSLTKSLKVIQLFSLGCFIALCFFLSKISLETIYFIVPFSLLTILYAVPFLSGFEKNLRQIGYLKIVVVALVWSGFTVLIPLLDAGVNITLPIIMLLLQRFLLVLVLILPFDIRDVKYDAISLQTIPKKIGVVNTKKAGILLLIISLVLEYLFSDASITKMPFMMFFFLTIILLMRAKKDQYKYYSSFWVEALPILWWLFLLGFHNF